MNYRHAFHAGNFADVHKHVVMLALLQRLQQKATPLFYLDTHAGRGAYALSPQGASLQQEWRAGIARVFTAKPHTSALQCYLQAVRTLNPNGILQRYPGSPLLALAALRPGDRAVYVEQQPDEARALQDQVREPRAVVICGDGYEALERQLPPKENRGLVLIDPPYEAEQEFTRLQRALTAALARWRNGVFACWYPIKAGPRVERFHAALAGSGLRKLLLLELNVLPVDSPVGLNGSGMLLANPPWQLEVEMAAALHELHQILMPSGGSVRVEWLVPE
jgi:23S rRNA (adenine2030-N6)-methyltransferase